MPSALATATSAPSARTAMASANQSRQNGGRCGLIEVRELSQDFSPRDGTEKGSLLMADRQRERERRARSKLALHPDPATKQLNELARERQSEPRTPHLLVRRAYLPELLEDRLLVLRRDTYTRVTDRDLGYAFVDRGADVDPATLGGELEC